MSDQLPEGDYTPPPDNPPKTPPDGSPQNLGISEQTIEQSYSSIQSFTPSNILPEPGDVISWDWLDVTSQWSLRLMNYTIATVTVANQGSTVFDYTSLKCDYIPPFLQSIVLKGTQWENPFTGTSAYAQTSHQGGPPMWQWTIANNGSYCWFQDVDMGHATFQNFLGTSYTFLLIAYL
jgi:hypothetical protein